MKKIIFSFGLFLSLMACTNQPPLGYALFSGKIDNFKGQEEVTLVKLDKSFKKEIDITSDGNFSDTLKVSPGFYLFNVGESTTRIYLDNESSIKLKADIKDFDNSVEFLGKGAKLKDYLEFKKEKTAYFRSKDRKAYKLEEVDFKSKLKEIYDGLNTKLDTDQGITSTFKVLEKRNLNYEYLNELERYAGGYHKQWAKKRNYKPSENFLAELEGIDLDDGEDFQFSGAYKEMVNRYYNKQINNLHGKDSLEYGLRGVTIYTTVPNQIIKNELIFKKAEYDFYQTKDFEKFYSLFINASTNEENNTKITKIYNEFKKLNKGEVSPKFIDYEKHSGGTLSLDDFKGKYVYIDVWATWCIPCIKEMPDLKRIEKAYHDKNISFLSISVDEDKNYEEWRKMVVDKKLGGIQVIADSAFNSQFIKDYIIKSIPRFILIDPNGLIVSQNAPKPSDPKLIDLFNELPDLK